MAREAMDVCLRELKESNKSRFDSYRVRNSVLIISHIAFRDCRVHFFRTIFLEIAVYYFLWYSDPSEQMDQSSIIIYIWLFEVPRDQGKERIGYPLYILSGRRRSCRGCEEVPIILFQSLTFLSLITC